MAHYNRYDLYDCNEGFEEIPLTPTPNLKDGMNSERFDESSVDESVGIEHRRSATMRDSTQNNFSDTSRYQQILGASYTNSSKGGICSLVRVWLRDFTLLLWRSTLNVYRNYGALGIRIVTYLFFSVILSLVYHDMSLTQKNIQDRKGIIHSFLR